MSARPVRALFVAPQLDHGGAERHLTTLLPRLDPARVLSTVVCIGGEGELFADLRSAGIDSTVLHGGRRNAWQVLRELVAIMRRQRPDVVSVWGYNAETLGRIAARVAGVRHSIMWVHNATEITARGLVHRGVDRALVRWTSRYFGVAESQRSFLVDDRGYPADRIEIICNGVDLARFEVGTDRAVLAELGIADDSPVVAVVAALRPEKDHATLLRAARLVVDRIPRARFLIVGDGECRPDLVARSEALGIAQHVHFAGARNDVGQLLRAIDVFSLTSTTECLPIALLEAMACGRPAVCTAVGGMTEVIEDGVTGFLVPPADPVALSDRLVRLLSDPERAHRMGRAARRRAEETYALERSVEATQQAIEQLVCTRSVNGVRI
jgi:glycosyltransferase involved in cell wall biosynthesis